MNATTQTPTIFPVRHWATVGLSALSVVGLIIVGQSVRAENRLTGLLIYQGITIGMALAYLLIVYLLHRQTFRQYAQVGEINAPAALVSWLGIKNGDRWGSVGRNFAIVITTVTGIFMYANVMQGNAPAWGMLPWALVLAASNAFVEEAITRLGVVVSLQGVVSARVIPLVSALVFGIPHYFGVPGGPIGAVMSGFLGWLLAKSVLETRGVFWAWFIHFLQDVVIFLILLSL